MKKNKIIFTVLALFGIESIAQLEPINAKIPYQGAISSGQYTVYRNPTLTGIAYIKIENTFVKFIEKLNNTYKYRQFRGKKV